MTTHPFAAPAPAHHAHYQPVIRYDAPPSPAARTRNGPRNGGLMFAGATFVFSAMLLAIAFAVTMHGYMGADAHWAANASLTAEARELGLTAVRQAASIRMALYGPGALALSIVGLVALISGARRR